MPATCTQPQLFEWSANARSVRSRAAAVLALALVFTATGQARAQDEEKTPEFSFGQRSKVTRSVVHASLNAGLLIVGGNANTTTASGGGFLSWRDPDNKLVLEGTGAYSRSQILDYSDANDDGIVQANEIFSRSQTAVQTWYTKLRYDRFFTEEWSAYLAGIAGADQLAGKSLYGGGQLGLARTLFTDDVHAIVAEAGYDFTHEEYVLPDTQGLSIHSARLFLGHTLTLATDASVQTSVEALSNVASQDTPTGKIDPFTDTRLVGKSAFTAKVWKNVSARFSFLMKYDHWPAPLPPFDLPFDSGLVVSADKLDTQTEFSLILNFL